MSLQDLFPRNPKADFPDMPWVEAINSGMQKRPLRMIFAMFLYFVIFVFIFASSFNLLIKLGILPFSVPIIPAVYMLGGGILLFRMFRRVSFKVGGNKYSGVYTVIKGFCMIMDMPASQYGTMIAAPQGIVYSPGKTQLVFSWTVYPIEEIVSVAVEYRDWAVFRTLHLTIKLQDGKTLLWQNRMLSHAGTLLKYLRENNYPVVETTGGPHSNPGKIF